MAVKKRPHVKLLCKDCKRVNYFVHKSKTVTEKKMELKKYCKWCRKHTVHKETR